MVRVMRYGEMRALQLAREDLCFAIDRFLDRQEDAYALRLLGTLDFIIETLDDSANFNDILCAWEKMHNSKVKKALADYRYKKM